MSHDAGCEQSGQQKRTRHLNELRSEQQLLPLCAVGEHAAHQRKQNDRNAAQETNPAQAETTIW